MVRRLFIELEDTNTIRKHYYAVCITKADQISDGIYRSPEKLIRRYFGEEMMKVLQIPDKERIKLFTTSSFGFIFSEDSISPEANFAGGILRDGGSWSPYHVEFPLFWAFLRLELSYFSKSQIEGRDG